MYTRLEGGTYTCKYFTLWYLQVQDIVHNIILCFAGQLSRKVREWHLSLSLYKLTAFVTGSISELSHCFSTGNK